MNSKGTDSVADFPIRHNYKAGKEMTADVFTEEQGYFNKKRYLLNRLVNGCGILHGLCVSVAESTAMPGGTSQQELPHICVSPGVAIDCYGREISVPTECERDLNDDLGLGFPNDFPEGDIYLCLTIGEDYLKTDPDTTTEDHKFLIERNLPVLGFDPRSLYTQTTVLFDENDLEIQRITPRWVNPNELFEVRLVVKALQDIPAHNIRVTESFDTFAEPVQGLDSDGAMTFTFDSLGKGNKIEMCYYLRSSAQPGNAEIEANLYFASVTFPVGNGGFP